MSRNKLIVKNTMFLATRTIVSLGVSFYTTRIILQQLGASDYGIFSVIYGVVAFFSFVITAMSDSVQRYIAFGVGTGQLESIKNAVKNSLFIFSSAGILLGVGLLIIKDMLVGRLLNIPAGSVDSALIVYIASVFTVILLILQTPFNSLVLAYERMSFYAYMMIFDVGAKLVMTLLLVITTKNKLIIYSILLTAVAVLDFFIYYIYCRLKFGEVLKGGQLNKNILKDITAFSLWNVFGNFSYMCRVQGINVVINMFFATTINAAYAISMTVLNAINSLTQSLIVALRPQIFKSYVENERLRYYSLIEFGSKYTFSFLFVISSPILICTDSLLKIWLGDIPLYTVECVRFIIVVALIDSFSQSIITGIQATGRIKKYQVVVSFFILLNLPITFILFKMGYSVLAMFIPFTITAVINLVLRVLFISSYSTFNYRSYIKKVISPCACSSVIAILLGYLTTKYIGPDSLVITLTNCILIAMLNVIVFYSIVVSKKEKKWLKELLIKKKTAH
ncbi:MAG: hypothetical protein ACK5JN_19640 [Kluyvera sp.]|uniref:hypothetical protein n=1 Tax=Kluyvera sp. TaxID=1538228 RepID=UPI003A8C13D2